MYVEWYGVCKFVVISVVEICVDYGVRHLYAFHVCFDVCIVYGVGICVDVCVVCFLHLGVVMYCSGWVVLSYL